MSKTAIERARHYEKLLQAERTKNVHLTKENALLLAQINALEARHSAFTAAVVPSFRQPDPPIESAKDTKVTSVDLGKAMLSHAVYGPARNLDNAEDVALLEAFGGDEDILDDEE